MVDITQSGFAELLYVDVLLGNSATVSETMNETVVGNQIYFTSYAAGGDRARIVGKDIFMYEDSTKARRLMDFTYEPLWGIFWLNEDVPLASVYVEYKRYNSRISIPVGRWKPELPEARGVEDIYGQPIYFDQPLFPRSLSFSILHENTEYGKLFIRTAVLDRQFFMVIDDNPWKGFTGYTLEQVATQLRNGYAYEGPVNSQFILNYLRGGPVHVPVKLSPHNFGEYYPASANWGGLGKSAITWRSNKEI